MGGAITLKANSSRFVPFLSSLTLQAPSFDVVSEFDKKANSLFPVHVHVTEQGLIFVNLSADPNVTTFEVSHLSPPANEKEYHRNLTKELSSFNFADFELLILGKRG